MPLEIIHSDTKGGRKELSNGKYGSVALQMSHFYNTVEVLHKKEVCWYEVQESLWAKKSFEKYSVCADHSIVHIPTRVSALEKIAWRAKRKQLNNPQVFCWIELMGYAECWYNIKKRRLM